MQINRRGFMGLLGAATAAIALRKVIALEAPQMFSVIGEPPEPMLPVFESYETFSDISMFDLLKQLYADDIIYQKNCNNFFLKNPTIEEFNGQIMLAI